jgi:hypothetical protein
MVVQLILLLADFLLGGVSASTNLQVMMIIEPKLSVWDSVWYRIQIYRSECNVLNVLFPFVDYSLLHCTYTICIFHILKRTIAQIWVWRTLVWLPRETSKCPLLYFFFVSNRRIVLRGNWTKQGFLVLGLLLEILHRPATKTSADWMINAPRGTSSIMSSLSFKRCPEGP